MLSFSRVPKGHQGKRRRPFLQKTRAHRQCNQGHYSWVAGIQHHNKKKKKEEKKIFLFFLIKKKTSFNYSVDQQLQLSRGRNGMRWFGTFDAVGDERDDGVIERGSRNSSHLPHLQQQNNKIVDWKKNSNLPPKKMSDIS